MPFKSLDDILKPDPRFADLCVVQGGIARRMTLADHHGAIAGISLSDAVPDECHSACNIDPLSRGIGVQN